MRRSRQRKRNGRQQKRSVPCLSNWNRTDRTRRHQMWKSFPYCRQAGRHLSTQWKKIRAQMIRRQMLRTNHLRETRRNAFDALRGTRQFRQGANRRRWPSHTNPALNKGIWDDIPSDNMRYRRKIDEGSGHISSHYFLIDKAGPISQPRRALEENKFHSTVRMCLLTVDMVGKWGRSSE